MRVSYQWYSTTYCIAGDCCCFRATFVLKLVLVFGNGKLQMQFLIWTVGRVNDSNVICEQTIYNSSTTKFHTTLFKEFRNILVCQGKFCRNLTGLKSRSRKVILLTSLQKLDWFELMKSE
jgi:hypothetical protein